jgi:hypothetical protein
METTAEIKMGASPGRAVTGAREAEQSGRDGT